MLLKDAIFYAKTILLEAFKDDLINAYNKKGFDVSQNKNLLNVVKVFNTNNYVKEKVKQDLGKPSNIGIALVDRYTPEQLVNYINKIDKEYDVKQQELKEKQEKKRAASSVSTDFYIYPCRTFEEAKSAAFSHTGNLERLSNQQIKEKYNIRVPEPASFYNTDKSLEEFLQFMKDAPFFMSPSWCITASEFYWDNYKLSVDKNSDPKCYIIISKQYPNLRFCIVKEKHNKPSDIFIDKNILYQRRISDALIREIRDPWQIGGHNTITTGEKMLKLAFNNINHTIAKILRTDNSSGPITDGERLYAHKISIKTFNYELPELINATYMFLGCTSLTSFNSDIPKLRTGIAMFMDCTSLTSFNSNILQLRNGREMFNYCESLTSFNSDLPNLNNGYMMFFSCTSLTSFDSDLSMLEDGNMMFCACTSLTSFDSDLPNLKDGSGMFSDCRLDIPSVVRIAKSIPETGFAWLTLGIDKNFKGDKNIKKAIRLIKNKGWHLKVEYN